MADDKRLDTIRALLALGSDPAASEQERETANRQASKLMAKYEVDEFDLMIAEGREFDLITGEAVGTRPGKTGARRVPPWINVISYGVKLFTGTRCTLGHDRVYFKGTRAGVELAQWMHQALVEGCYRASQGRPDSAPYRNGYASAIQGRLKAMSLDESRVTVGEGTSTALAVVRTRLEEAMNAKWGEPGKGVSISAKQGAAGYAAGQSAHIPTNRPVTSGGHLKLT